MAPYLTADQAKDRLLARYKTVADLTDGDLEAASDELDLLSPFIGSKYASDQPRQFPRDTLPDGSTATGMVPDSILDAVSLLAMEYVVDYGPPVRSEAAMSATVIYERPKRSVLRRRCDSLIAPHLKVRGYSAGGATINPADPFNRVPS